jgi:hypothetical protein
MQSLFAIRLREEHVEAKHYPGIYDGYLGSGPFAGNATQWSSRMVAM